MGKWTARLLTPDDEAAHTALWEACAHRYLAQHPAFARHVTSGDERDSPHVGVFDGERLRMVVGFTVRWRGGEHWQSPLFTSFRGPLVGAEDAALDGPAAERFWRDALAALADALPARVSSAEIIAPPGVSDLRELAWRGWQLRPHYNYVSRWEAPGGWREQMDASARRQARKAEDAGLRAVIGAANGTEPLAVLWQTNAARQRLDAQLAARFNRFGAWLAQQQSGFTARIVDGKGDVHAAALLGFDRERVYYLAGASDPAHLGSGAPTLLHAEILEEIDRRGLARCYDWVGANTPNIVRFKRGFGPRLELLFAARRVNRRTMMLETARRLLRGR